VLYKHCFENGCLYVYKSAYVILIHLSLGYFELETLGLPGNELINGYKCWGEGE